MTTNDGGPAFPRPGQKVDFGDGWLPAQDGMSLRDWFAGQALAAVNHNDLTWGTVAAPRDPWPDVAKECYRAADAMLRERER